LPIWKNRLTKASDYINLSFLLLFIFKQQLAASGTERHNDNRLLERAFDQLGLSASSYHRIPKVARNIADLSDEPHVQTQHLTEAVGYRRLDRTPT